MRFDLSERPPFAMLSFALTDIFCDISFCQCRASQYSNQKIYCCRVDIYGWFVAEFLGHLDRFGFVFYSLVPDFSFG